MAAGCLAICCYAMILSYYSNSVSWYCNARTLKNVLSGHCLQIVTLLLYSYSILLSYYWMMLLSDCYTSTLLFMLLRLFYTMGFICTSQHFCPSQSLKTTMGPNVFSYTLS